MVQYTNRPFNCINHTHILSHNSVLGTRYSVLNITMDIHQLPNLPIHLYQLNKNPKAYHNPMGCGAFTTSMALSCYNPARFGNYSAARYIFHKMVKVPFFGGTFESQNARIARHFRFTAHPQNRGTISDLTTAIDLGAPTILLINPGFLGIGRHDVLLVGYGTDSSGNPTSLFVNNPAIESDTQSSSGRQLPGNETYPVATFSGKWTRCFTPIFPNSQLYAQWQSFTHRN